MAKKTVKKVDVKKVAKLSVSKEISEFFASKGLVVEDGQDFGFTEGTLVLHTEKCDIQIKLIAPKTGLERYDKVVEEEEGVEETSEDTSEEKSEE